VSFCRWSTPCEDGRVSDLYVFHHVDGYLICFCCEWSSESPEPDDPSMGWVTTEPAAMAAHLRRHVEAGHAVPERAVRRMADYAMDGRDW